LEQALKKFKPRTGIDASQPDSHCIFICQTGKLTLLIYSRCGWPPESMVGVMQRKKNGARAGDRKNSLFNPRRFYGFDDPERSS